MRRTDLSGIYVYVYVYVAAVALCAATVSTSGCVRDRELANVYAQCDNDICEPTEDPDNCPSDCELRTCGNNWCEFGEDVQSCPEDCPSVECGDGYCESWENPYSCPADCRRWLCGNGLCEPGEASGACPADCFPGYCGNGICEHQETPADCSEDCSKTTQLDLLFVIDDSPSMLNEQANLQAQFVVLTQAFESAIGEVPDFHIGVITPDLGTGNYSTIRFCEELGGDAGILGKVGSYNLGATCIGAGQRYIVDIEPPDCEIDKYHTGECASHACTQANCDSAAQANEVLSLVTDNRGCPRCRNYSGTLSDTFACLAGVGANGCGFEQQLEAMRKALDDSQTPENIGFLRADSLLSVIIISDEDDCSASKPDIIFNADPAENRIDSTLGYLHSFRCFEFGIICDVNGRDLGPRNNCEPREDPGALLHPMSRYVDFLLTLRDPGQLVVAALAGPYHYGDEVVVQMDSQNRPELRTTCTDSAGQGATPAVRFGAFVEYFADPDEIGAWAFTSVCSNDFSAALQGIGDAIRKRLGYDAQ